MHTLDIASVSLRLNAKLRMATRRTNRYNCRKYIQFPYYRPTVAISRDSHDNFTIKNVMLS